MKKNGRYWLFAFNYNDVKGGINDFIFSFNNIDEFENLIVNKDIYNYYHVLDTNSNFHFSGDLGTITKWICKNIGGEIYESQEFKRN